MTPITAILKGIFEHLQTQLPHLKITLLPVPIENEGDHPSIGVQTPPNHHNLHVMINPTTTRIILSNSVSNPNILDALTKVIGTERPFNEFAISAILNDQHFELANPDFPDNLTREIQERTRGLQ